MLATVGGVAARPRRSSRTSRRSATRWPDARALSLLPQPDGILQLVTVPVYVGLTRPDILGTLSVGFLLDNALAAQLKQITGSDIAFGMDGQILAATLPREHYPALAERLRTTGISRRAARRRGVRGAAAAARRRTATRLPASSGPVALILRSRTEQLQSLAADSHRPRSSRRCVAVLLATLLSFAVARTIAQPLAAITDVMREVAATGDLTRKIALRHGNRWDDDDARLLATTFNTLTDSIARFQREMSQKERLTSLGRLSTVIAHEVRNPLMIIKAALHTLRQPDAAPAAMREAIADIDEEVVRLNRIVNEVLDFARPIRFELSRRRPQRAVPRVGGRGAWPPAPAPAIALRSRPGAADDDDRPRAAADRARQPARQRAPRGERHGRAARPKPVVRLLSRAACLQAVRLERDRRVDGERVRIVHRRPGAGIARPTCRTSSTRTSRPSAAAPASACRSPRTSSRVSAARSPCRATRAAAPRSIDRPVPSTRRGTRARRRPSGSLRAGPHRS